MRIRNDKQAQEVCEIIVMLTGQFINYIAQGRAVEHEIISRRQFKLDLLRTYLQEQNRISVNLIDAIQNVIIANEKLVRIVGVKKALT